MAWRQIQGACFTLSGIMASGNVCAVIYGAGSGPPFDDLVGAVAQQSVAPTVILAAAGALDGTGAAARLTPEVASFTPVGREGEFVAGVRAAASRGIRWTWLLDGDTVPAPEALRDLLGAVDALAAPAPLLMVSRVLDEQGRLHADAIPRHELFEKERSVDAVERHLVQLRTAAHGSVLVDTAAVERFGLPRSDLPGGLDMIEWSARILRSWEDTGYLVPASVAVRRAAPVAHPWRYWLGRARVLGSGGWSPTEKLWETFLLGGAIAAMLRGAPGQGRAAVGAPGLNPSRSPRRMAGITRTAKRLKRR